MSGAVLYYQSHRMAGYRSFPSRDVYGATIRGTENDEVAQI